MLRNLFTLFRGAAHAAADDVTDRNALLILQQQMREAAGTVGAARRAVAVAIAQNQQDAAQKDMLVARIADLEARALSALGQGKDDLAMEAADAIAMLDAEREVSEQAQAHFSKEIERLKQNVRFAEAKLRELQQGQRLAVVRDKTLRVRSKFSSDNMAGLEDAEETLKKLQKRQEEMDLTADALDAFAEERDPTKLVEKLANAGCGTAIKTTASDVLDRLRDRLSAADALA